MHQWKVVSQFNLTLASRVLTFLNNSTYAPVKPQVIRLGHLVEVQGTVSAIPSGPRSYRLITKLMSICILDRIVETVSRSFFLSKVGTYRTSLTGCIGHHSCCTQKLCS